MKQTATYTHGEVKNMLQQQKNRPSYFSYHPCLLQQLQIKGPRNFWFLQRLVLTKFLGENLLRLLA